MNEKNFKFSSVFHINIFRLSVLMHLFGTFLLIICTAFVIQACIPSQGQQGQQGPPGRDGNKGPKGPKGPRGAQGESGLKGLIGDPGVRGRPGMEGEEGPTGPPGDEGPQGIIALFSINFIIDIIFGVSELLSCGHF
uniref:Bm10494 n=1 Tax=Brugia malayi TaxID=6279 RepID=A0A1I9GDC0_BRUMA|nr:Bm10494 [Brugia malayi]